MISGNSSNGGYSYSDKFNYEIADIENAMTCLMKMQKFEDRPNYGQLTYKSSRTSRYNINEYVNKIDSLHYTDLATSTLAYTMYFLKNNCGAEFSQNIYDNSIVYARDLIENDEGTQLELFGEMLSFRETINYGNAGNSVKLYNYLKANYDVVEERVSNDGNVYYYVENEKNEYYFSADFLSDDVNVYGYYPGTGGPHNDYISVQASIEQNGVLSNSVVALSKNYVDSNMKLFSVIDEAKENFDFDIESVNLVTFSGSGGTGFNILNNYLQRHEEIKESSMIVLDGYIMEGIVDNPNQWQNSEIIKRGTNIYMVEPTHPFGREYTRYTVPKMTETLNNIGFNAFYVKETSGTRHDANFSNKIIADGLDLYLFGEVDVLANASHYGFVKDVVKYSNGEIGLESMNNILRGDKVESGSIEIPDYDTEKLYNYLKENYSGFEERMSTDGNVYYYVRDEKNEYYFPADFNGENIDVYGYYPGDGSVVLTYSNLLSSIKETGVSANSVIAVAGHYSDTDAGLFSVVDDVKENIDFNIGSVNVATFSASGGTGFETMETYLRRHDEIKNSSLIVCDGDRTDVVIDHLAEWKDSELIKRGTNIYMVEPTWSNNKAEKYKVPNAAQTLNSAGFNVFYVKENSGSGHNQWFTNKLITDGLYLYLFGKVDTLANASDYGFAKDIVRNDEGQIELESMDNIPRVNSVENETVDTPNNNRDNINLPDVVMGTIYNQHNYNDIPYWIDGNGVQHNVGASGCGFFSALSVITAKTGHVFTREEIEYLVENVAGGQNGKSNEGRMELLLSHLGEQYGFTWKRAPYSSGTFMSELEKGNAIITYTTVNGDSSGHFIPITGILDNGNIAINDTSTILPRNKVEVVGFTSNEVHDNELYVTKGDIWYIDFSEYYGSEQYNNSSGEVVLNNNPSNIVVETPVVNTTPSDTVVETPVVDDTLSDTVVETPVVNTTPSDTVVDTPVVNTIPSDTVVETPVVNTTPSDTVVETPVVNTTPSDTVVETPVVDDTPSDTVVETPVVDDTPSDTVVETPVVNTTPSDTVVETPVVDDTPSDIVIDTPVVETPPSVEMEKPPVVEDDIHNKPSGEANIGSNVSSSDSGVDAKKYIIPGIIGTGLALLSAKISNFIKKKKKNNDV